MIIFSGTPPLVGDEVWCLKCRKYTEVEYAPDEWHIKCQECKFSDNFSGNKILAEIGAGKHRRRKGNEEHVVILYNGRKAMRVFDGRMPTLDEAQYELGTEVSEIPY